MAQLFLSYHSTGETEQLADRIEEAIAERGWTLWRYRRDIESQAGEPWRRIIHRQIAKSRAGLLLLDKATAAEKKNFSIHIAHEAGVLKYRAETDGSFLFLGVRLGVKVESAMSTQVKSATGLDSDQFLDAGATDFLRGKLLPKLGQAAPSSGIAADAAEQIALLISSLSERNLRAVGKTLDDMLGQTGTAAVDPSQLPDHVAKLILGVEDMTDLIKALTTLRRHNPLSFQEILAIALSVQVPGRNLELLMGRLMGVEARKLIQLRHDRTYLVNWQMLRAFLPSLEDLPPIEIEMAPHKFDEMATIEDRLQAMVGAGVLEAAQDHLHADRPKLVLLQGQQHEVSQAVSATAAVPGLAVIFQRDASAQEPFPGVNCFGPVLTEEEATRLNNAHKQIKWENIPRSDCGGQPSPAQYLACPICDHSASHCNKDDSYGEA